MSMSEVSVDKYCLAYSYKCTLLVGHVVSIPFISTPTSCPTILDHLSYSIQNTLGNSLSLDLLNPILFTTFLSWRGKVFKSEFLWSVEERRVFPAITFSQLQI